MGKNNLIRDVKNHKKSNPHYEKGENDVKKVVGGWYSPLVWGGGGDWGRWN
jgi:hypothetical protein